MNTKTPLRWALLPWVVTAACFLVVCIFLSYQAIGAAAEFHEMITSKEAGLLFKFSFSAIGASFFLGATVTFVACGLLMHLKQPRVNE